MKTLLACFHIIATILQQEGNVAQVVLDCYDNINRVILNILVVWGTSNLDSRWLRHYVEKFKYHLIFMH